MRTPAPLEGTAMPMTYRIDRDARLVRIHGQGLVTDDEMVASVAALREDPNLEPDMNTLSDMRDIEVGFTTKGVVEMVGVMEQSAARRSAAKAAIVTNSDTAFGMARMFQARSTMKDQDPQFRIFRDMGEACAWLGIK